MHKFLAQKRKTYGTFECIDVVEDFEVASIRGKLDVPHVTSVRWNSWEYAQEAAEFRALYEKGKREQWNASSAIDWSQALSNDVFIGNPENSVTASLVKLLGGDEATQKAAMFDEVAWTVSQLLHGEQAALQISGQLTNLCASTEEKFFAASQVMDEARHTEAFARLIGEKMGKIYPIAPGIKVLLDELLSVHEPHMKILGMQTLFEGVALGIMDRLNRTVTNPLFREVLRRVQIDEARHAAFGVLSLRRAELTEVERQRMEDWALTVLEALNASQSLALLREVGEPYGIDAEVVMHEIVQQEGWQRINSEPFMHTVVPNLLRLGLITDRTRADWERLGMLSDSRRAGHAA